MTVDLRQRYHAHFAEYCAAWGVPERLRYVSYGAGQESGLCLEMYEARFYTSWLEHHGYITTGERRWLWKDIDQHATDDEA